MTYFEIATTTTFYEDTDENALDEEFDMLMNEIYFEDENSNNVNNVQEGNDSPSSSQNCSVIAVQGSNAVKKRRRFGRNPTNRVKTRNPAFIQGLRILRRDVRRRYAEMFTNTVNSHDAELVARFFNEFSIPNCKFFMRCIPANHGPQFPELCIGPSRVLQSIALMEFIEPDLVFRMKDCEIRVGEDFHGTIIKGRYFIQTTRLYEYCGPSDSSSDPSESLILRKPEFDDRNTIYMNNFKWTLMQSPIEMMFECEITMKLDHNHKIISMDTEGLHYEEHAL